MAANKVSSPDTRGVRRLSSLLINSPAKSTSPRKVVRSPAQVHIGRQYQATEEEVIPDSEEERLRDVESSPSEEQYPSNRLTTAVRVHTEEVIVISSDEEEPIFLPAKAKPSFSNDDPFLDTPAIPGGWPARAASRSGSGSDTEELSEKPWKPFKAARTPRARRTILSSSESESDSNAGQSQDAAEMGGDSPERLPVSKHKPKPSAPTNRFTHNPPFLAAPTMDGDSTDDGAILILNEPKGAHKPIRRPVPSTSVGSGIRHSPLTPSTPSGGRVLVSDRTPLQTPLLSRTQSSPTPEHRRSPSESPEPIKPKSKSLSDPRLLAPSRAASASPRKGRVTKKALAEAEQSRREGYAQELFEELNTAVFGGALPQGTALVWNKRLQTTAGRAKWHRSKDGTETSCIELATKVLDCEERIRNTLSHEMCHLACWTINGDPKEGHGSIWKGWANKVMKKRADIVVTTKHAYEIVYKYEWQCNKCSKIYGRHSKSIDPVKCICSVCKEGDLVPLFATAQRAPRTPKTKADSCMAAGQSRDSPTPSSTPRVARPAVSIPILGGNGSSGPKRVHLSKPATDDVDALTNKMLYIDLTQD